MKISRYLFAVILVCLTCFHYSPVHAADDQWKYLTEKEGIKVYSKSVTTSKVKALKVECVLNTNLSSIVTLLLDIPATKEWVYHTKSCILLKQVSPSELYYYSEVNLPWPLENRDFVAHVKVTQDKTTKVVTVEAPAIPGMVASKSGIVRVPHSVGYWVITPLDNNNIKVSYSLQVDPGGVIPAWAVNALSSQGPLESFLNMKKMLKLPAYKNATPNFIQN